MPLALCIIVTRAPLAVVALLLLEPDEGEVRVVGPVVDAAECVRLLQLGQKHGIRLRVRDVDPLSRRVLEHARKPLAACAGGRVVVDEEVVVAALREIPAHALVDERLLIEWLGIAARRLARSIRRAMGFAFRSSAGRSLRAAARSWRRTRRGACRNPHFLFHEVDKPLRRPRTGVLVGALLRAIGTIPLELQGRHAFHVLLQTLLEVLARTPLIVETFFGLPLHERCLRFLPNFAPFRRGRVPRGLHSGAMRASSRIVFSHLVAHILSRGVRRALLTVQLAHTFGELDEIFWRPLPGKLLSDEGTRREVADHGELASVQLRNDVLLLAILEISARTAHGVEALLLLPGHPGGDVAGLAQPLPHGLPPSGVHLLRVRRSGMQVLYHLALAANRLCGANDAVMCPLVQGAFGADDVFEASGKAVTRRPMPMPP
mmetsp:Transcript_113387/g.320877  ORF Transcript_113387/g.320877 Transcript_113387/m.320877 type:complete len:432 (+) Transcript_113387:650-1945(+)